MKLYYFSATGNSLTTARKLAEALDAELVNIAGIHMQSKTKEEDSAVGFVFPVYYGDMPYPVRNLLSHMVFNENAYIFIVTTWRGHAGSVAQKFDQLLRTRGQKLALSVGLPMPGNSFINAPEVDQKYLEEQDLHIAELITKIRKKEVQEYSTMELLGLRPVAYPNNFRGIMADENCIGCGFCAQVCPMKNIRLINGRAIIGDDCATCLACFHWCPEEAIYMSKQEGIERRRKYHHPDVKAEDFIIR